MLKRQDEKGASLKESWGETWRGGEFKGKKDFITNEGVDSSNNLHRYITSVSKKTGSCINRKEKVSETGVTTNRDEDTHTHAAAHAP